jgi:hypothetical protein
MQKQIWIKLVITLYDFLRINGEQYSFTLGELEDCDVAELIRELLIFNEKFILTHKISIKMK